jgi:hypothetical protein
MRDKYALKTFSIIDRLLLCIFASRGYMLPARRESVTPSGFLPGFLYLELRGSRSVIHKEKIISIGEQLEAGNHTH